MFSYYEEIILILYILFQRMEKEETLPTSVYEVCITLFKHIYMCELKTGNQYLSWT